jgi:TM2 domain-containing membrane protein YozV
MPARPAVEPAAVAEVAPAPEKSMLLAHVVWFFLGVAGGHRFYLGRPGSAAVMLALFVLALAVPGWTGLALLLVPFLWAAIDLFRLPAMVRERRRGRTPTI